jgi:hypothetical protein
MPTIMTLQGLSPQLLGSLAEAPTLLGLPPPKATTLAGLRGVADTLMQHWFVVLVGLAVGGYVADKHLLPRGGAWGEMQARHSRERALHGSRRRR